MTTASSSLMTQPVYGLNDRPPFAQACVLGLQHVLTMFGSTMAIPLLFGPALWPVDVTAEPAAQAAQSLDQARNIAVLISDRCVSESSVGIVFNTVSKS